jgi:hypothetical protein
MEQAEIQEKIMEYMEQMKGKKKLKEKDVIKKIVADTSEEKDTVNPQGNDQCGQTHVLLRRRRKFCRNTERRIPQRKRNAVKKLSGIRYQVPEI